MWYTVVADFAYVLHSLLFSFKSPIVTFFIIVQHKQERKKVRDKEREREIKKRQVQKEREKADRQAKKKQKRRASLEKKKYANHDRNIIQCHCLLVLQTFKIILPEVASYVASYVPPNNTIKSTIS